MKRWISFPHQEGQISRQAHADFPKEGVYEREFGVSGFFGPATHFHHQHPPTQWVDWEGPLKPRAFYLNQLSSTTESPWSAPLVLHNAHCKIRMWTCSQAMPNLARNVDGDELLFVHDGAGELFSDFGHLSIKEGDYVVIPRCTTWRLEPSSPMSVLMVEATNESYQLPDKGILGNHAIFDPAMLDVPKINDAFKAQQGEETWHIEIKARNQISKVTFPFNPLDAIGWHGDVSVVRINWRDIRPLMSHRYHLPPSAHTTFLANRFVVCTFVPRPIESDPGALKVPFYHNNNDYDEVLFYHRGEFFSRDNVEAGMITLHPTGFAHGPHPKAFKKSMEDPHKETNEVAVMVDTRDPLEIPEVMESVEWKDYVNSWKES